MYVLLRIIRIDHPMLCDMEMIFKDQIKMLIMGPILPYQVNVLTRWSSDLHILLYY